MFRQVIELINNAQKIAIYTHVNPDGDALGSAYALKIALIEYGKVAQVFLEQPCNTKEYKMLYGNDESDLNEDECDLKIAVDCADAKRLGVKLKSFTGVKTAIDHHDSYKEFADVSVVNSKASATGEIIFELIEKIEVDINLEIAQNLYIAIVSDTGCFKYSNVSDKTHEIAAKLIRTGIDTAKICRELFETYTVKYLNLYSEVVKKLEFYNDGRIALMVIEDEVFKRLGVSEQDVDAIVNLPRSIEGVEVGVYIRERDDKEYKISLRSNDYMNVAEIAQVFGGGGHLRASGYNMKESLDDIKAKTISEIGKRLK